MRASAQVSPIDFVVNFDEQTNSSTLPLPSSVDLSSENISCKIPLNIDTGVVTSNTQIRPIDVNAVVGEQNKKYTALEGNINVH